MPEDKVVVGLSGGADSVVLLHMLVKEKKSIYACHCNHLLRKEEANRDEDFVVSLCERLKVPLKVVRFDVLEYAKLHKLSTEEAGRILRYQALEKYAEELGAKIALAHNKNDQAETVLFNLFRGSGTTGLAGIPPVRGNIIRPLLGFSRAEIETICLENNIAYVSDSTNAENDYSRNKIRNLLLPQIENLLGYSPVNNIAKTSSIIYEENMYFEEITQTALEECLVKKNNEFALDITILNNYHKVLQKKIVLSAIRKFSKKDFTYGHVNAVLALLSKENGEIHLPHSVVAKKEFNTLYFLNNAEKSRSFWYNLEYEEACFIQELGLYVKMSERPFLGARIFYFDERPEICARTRQVGDKIYFNSIGGSKKIKDFFIEQKVPASRRDNVLLIAVGADILWVRIGERDIFSNRYDTKKDFAVYISYEED